MNIATYRTLTEPGTYKLMGKKKVVSIEKNYYPYNGNQNTYYYVVMLSKILKKTGATFSRA